MVRLFSRFFIIKILFLTDNFPPEVNAPATRTYEHCVEWVKSGVEVTVVTCFPNFPKGEVFSGYKNKLFSVENINGIKVIRVWTYIAANEGFIKRTIDYLSFAFMAIIFSIRINHDIIIATSPQFFTAVAGLILSKIKRKPWIMEIRDLWPQSIIEVGAIKNKLIINILSYLELKCYNSAKSITCVTDSFKQHLISMGIKKQKINVIKNGANLELFNPLISNNNIWENYEFNSKFIVAYIGTLGMAHGLDFIVNTISNLNDKDIHLVLMGEGANKNELQDKVLKNGIRNISIIDSVQKNQIPDYISSIDVALINLKKSPLFKTVIPSKIFENAAMGKPILLGVNGEAREIIENYSCGLYYEPENANDFIDKLLLLKSDSKLYNKCCEGSKRLATDFDRKKLASKMLIEIQKTGNSA